MNNDPIEDLAKSLQKYEHDPNNSIITIGRDEHGREVELFKADYDNWSASARWKEILATAKDDNIVRAEWHITENWVYLRPIKRWTPELGEHEIKG